MTDRNLSRIPSSDAGGMFKERNTCSCDPGMPRSSCGMKHSSSHVKRPPIRIAIWRMFVWVYSNQGLNFIRSLYALPANERVDHIKSYVTGFLTDTRAGTSLFKHVLFCPVWMHGAVPHRLPSAIRQRRQPSKRCKLREGHDGLRPTFGHVDVVLK